MLTNYKLYPDLSIFHGGDKWEMKAYDAIIGDEGITEILLKPNNQ